MKWLKEYKQSLKSLHAEEPLDVYFFRPLAFVVVKTFYSLPITPNQYSLAALIAGIASGYNFLKGTSLGFKWGAFYFLLFAILDCCDGMVARLKKNGTEFGRLIDGIVDYLVNTIVFVTLALGLKKQYSPDLIQPWVLVIVAGVSKAIHSMSYDHYLNEYLSYEKGDGGFVVREIETLKKKLVTNNGTKVTFVRRFALKLYLAYSNLQAGNQEKTLVFNPKTYCDKNFLALKMWSFIGPAVHILVFIISCILNEPYLLFFYAVVFGNLWLGMMFIYQLKLNQELTEEKRI
ncbi:MAG: CDP-alcohol phosphatidyltransferase family protein [Bacteriovorax sp.]|nr:CDP-alcohol phosphatidyltransferase family protein [Bacteriovorax sp.]